MESRSNIPVVMTESWKKLWEIPVPFAQLFWGIFRTLSSILDIWNESLPNGSNYFAKCSLYKNNPITFTNVNIKHSKMVAFLGEHALREDQGPRV